MALLDEQFWRLANIFSVGGGVIHDVPADATPLSPAWRNGGLISLNIASGWPNTANSTVKDFIKAAVTERTQAFGQLISSP